MLVFYSICIVGLITATFFWLNRTNQTLSINTTSTAFALATQQAQSTATSVARATELAQYEIIDQFDSNKNKWQTGPQLGPDWDGTPHLKSGVFVWDIENIYQDYAMISMDFVPVNDYIKNYDAYVDTKLSTVPSGTACSGLMFRKAPLGWNNGGYSFVICNQGYFSIHYHNGKDGWKEINSQYLPIIQPFEWNRLEVLVHDSHFVFLINSQVVYETDDDRQSVGGVALMVEVEKGGTQILFDNLGFQSH
jgi:hypothetical protein